MKVIIQKQKHNGVFNHRVMALYLPTGCELMYPEFKIIFKIINEPNY